MTILTGDTHGELDRIEEFVEEYELTREDVIVILGDAGLNYFLDERDEEKKERLARLDVTLFCIHGNHEERPENLTGYEEMVWRGGVVSCEGAYPNILFARDGEVYEFGTKKALVIGGAYSVDKYYRIANGLPWFDSEQPDEAIKARVETKLKELDWQVDYVFSHTVPYIYMPRHALLPTIDQSTVDNSTEKWLDWIEKRLTYETWYAGHFHITEQMGRVCILYEDYEELEE